jgi:hypothetical protein
MRDDGIDRWLMVLSFFFCFCLSGKVREKREEKEGGK